MGWAQNSTTAKEDYPFYAKGIADSAKLATLHNYIWENWLFTDVDSALKYIQFEQQWAKEFEAPIFKVRAKNLEGILAHVHGNYVHAFTTYSEALTEARTYGFQKEIAQISSNIGNIYVEQKHYEKAIAIYQTALATNQAMNDLKGQSVVHNNLGTIYKRLNKYDTAIMEYQKSMALKMELHDTIALANGYSNIGYAYLGLDMLDSAEVNFQKGAKWYGDSATAIMMAALNNGFAQLALKRGEYAKSEAIARAVYTTCEDASVLDEQIDALTILFETAKHQKNIDSVVAYSERLAELEAERSAQILDSELERKMTSFELERAAMELKHQQQIEEQRLAEVMAQRNAIQYSGISVVVIALFAGVFLISRFKVPEWALEFALFLPALVLFEFLMVIADSILENYTALGPGYALLINVILAMCIFPLHQYFEGMVRKRVYLRVNKVVNLQ